MKEIFLITGETGEYDSWESWIVAAFLNEVLCLDYLNKLNQFLIENKIPVSSDNYNYTEVQLSSSPLDPKLINHLRRNYGVEYKVERVQLLDA